VEDIKGVDLGLFDFDMEANMYFFVMSPDEQILLRYTGRDSRGPVTYYSTEGHETALTRGLEQYRRYRAGEVPRLPRPEPEFQEDYRAYPSVEDRLSKNACVRCHHIAEARVAFAQEAGTLDKLNDLWLFPDGRSLGMAFEVDTGTVLAEVSGPVRDAGARVGDEVVEVAGRDVLTFGDIQYQLDRVPGDAEHLDLGLRRGDDRLEVRLDLPPFWKASDHIAGQHRFFVLDPFPGFWGRALDPRERAELGLPIDGLATLVERFWAETTAYQAGLREGDVILAIDGLEQTPASRDARVYLRLFREVDDEVTLTVLRGPDRLRITYRLSAGR
jgi:membrane-associated protease RseP (regulator of RpoE activity)